MRYYVDFENVGTSGLTGIEQLTENDCVTIYYSNNPNVNMETVINIKKFAAKIQFLKLSDSLKKMNFSNALDILILTDVSKILPLSDDNFCIIISKDKGYDNIIGEFNKENGSEKIFRESDISDAVKKYKSNNKVKNSTSVNVPHKTLKVQKTPIDEIALENLFKKELLKYKQKKNKIIQIVRSSKSRCEINNRIGKSFTGADQKKIMGKLKPIIKNLPGS